MSHGTAEGGCPAGEAALAGSFGPLRKGASARTRTKTFDSARKERILWPGVLRPHGAIFGHGPKGRVWGGKREENGENGGSALPERAGKSRPFRETTVMPRPATALDNLSGRRIAAETMGISAGYRPSFSHCVAPLGGRSFWQGERRRGLRRNAAKVKEFLTQRLPKRKRAKVHCFAQIRAFFAYFLAVTRQISKRIPARSRGLVR